MTQTLLIVGIATAVAFVVVILVEGALRQGYDPMYHTGSELELGPRGWVQRANFFLVGAGMFAFAVGVYDALGTLVGAILLSIFGLGMVVAGAFAPDAVRGYPPGAPRNPRARPSWVGLAHNIIAGFVLTIGTGFAFQRDAARTGLVQRGLLVAWFGWIALLGLHLIADLPRN